MVNDNPGYPDISQACKPGANSYVVKPVDLKLFLKSYPIWACTGSYRMNRLKFLEDTNDMDNKTVKSFLVEDRPEDAEFNNGRPEKYCPTVSSVWWKP